MGDAFSHETLKLPKLNLVRGVNLLAAEVHQIIAFSSDIVFGFELTLEYLPGPSLPELNFRREGAALVISWDAEGATLESAPVLDHSWSPVMNQTNPYTVVPSPNEQRFYRLVQ